MRFLEFVPCGRRASAPPDQAAPRRAPEVATAPATNPLPGSAATAPVAAPSHGKRRRRAAGAPGSAAARHWRPSLGAISEDGVLPLEATSEGTGGRLRAAAQPVRAKAAPSARARGLDYRDDYRHFTAPAVFPAFAPTAFLF